MSAPPAEALKNEGNRRLKEGDFEGAERSYRAALAIAPDFAHAHANLGTVLLQRNHPQEALASLEAALQLDPTLVNAEYGLSHAYTRLGNRNQARVHLDRTLALAPDFVPALVDLGNLHHAQQRPEEAYACYRRALAAAPDQPEAHANLGLIAMEQGRFDAAVAHCRRALELRDDFAEVHFILGGAYQGQNRLTDAVASYRAAIRHKPDYAEAYSNLASALVGRGELDETIALTRKALEYKPDLAIAHSSLIFALDLAVGETVASQQAERRRWDARHTASLPPPCPHSNRPDPERRLRIGYVSADFRTHLGGCVFAAMLVQYDRERFDVFCYSNGSPEDTTTAALRPHVAAWREIFRMSDDAAADLIRSDGIDILVDLAGHSPGNSLLVFARKPAPIQVTAWGFATSTGMRAMDVFFADAVIVPPEEKPLYVEDVRYLPNVISYYQPQTLPPVNALPAAGAGIVTFGSLNRLVKISEPAFDLWAEVLRAVPNSRLLLKAGELSDPTARARVTARFTAAGIASDRIELRGRTSWYDHLATFHEIDIALDPFPHGGGVTALEGLAMGVPYIALRWPSPVGRTSVSVLTTLDLRDWIAEDKAQYIRLAQEKSRDLDALATLRAELRARFKASVIGDTPSYVRAVEHEYRQLWREWCERAQDERP